MKNLKNIIGLATLLGLSTTGLFGCADDSKSKNSGATVPNVSESQRELTSLLIVNEEGLPIPNAQILIGLGANSPFQGNTGKTDEKGQFAIPSAWSEPEMVTIDAPGYLRATYMAQSPKARKFRLKKKFVAQAELKGVTSGHPIVHKDGFIDFTLVMSAMTRQDLLNFQFHKIMSPVNDTVSAIGMDMPLPSNVSLPKQTENYFIGITLEKPSYRLFLPNKGPQRVFAARGRFPFKPVVDGLRNDLELYQLINYFTITGGSIRDVNLVEDQTKLNIPVTDLTFKTKREFKAPALEKGQVLVALPVADNNGYLIPTDVKRLNSEQSVKLAVWDENPAYMAQVIKNQSEFVPNKPGLDRLSATFLPFEANMKASFMPLIKNPTVKSKMNFVVPEVSADLHRLVTYAVISDVKVSKNRKGETVKTPDQVWEIYAPAWATEIVLPQWEWQKASPGTRFEVSLVGSLTQVEMPLGPELMEKATHVTRSSVDY